METIIGIAIFVLCMGIPFFVLYFLMPFRRNFRKGISSLKQERYEEALKYFNLCIEKYPENYPSIYYRACALLELKRYEEAERDIRKIITLKPAEAKGLFLQIELYDKTKEPSLLIQTADAILKLGNYNYQALVSRAAGYMDMEKYDLAIEDLDNTIRMEPDNALGYNHRGLTYAHLGEFGKAFEDFEISEKLDPGNPHLYLHKGIAYYLEGKYEKAKPNLEKAVEMDEYLKDEAQSYLDKITNE